MVPRMKYARILAGMGALTAMLSSGIEAYAGSSAIVVTGGYKPGGGDPPYDYIFNVYLEPPPNPPGGSNFIASGDYFTITGLPGVTSGSLSSQPFAPPWVPEPGKDGSMDSPNTMQWAFVGSTDILADASTGPIHLGQFVVETTASFATPPVTNGEIILYHFGYDGGAATGTGSFQIFAVPEPSSIILLVAGAGALPVFSIRKRRQRVRRSQQSA